MHQVLDAKLLGPAVSVLSIATQFIHNRDVQSVPAGAARAGQAGLRVKALRRLLTGCGVLAVAHLPQRRQLVRLREGFQIASDFNCDYIYVFKPGRTPTLRQDFQACCVVPHQQVELTTPREFASLSLAQPPALHRQRRREWTFNALVCTQTTSRERRFCGLV